MDIVKKNLVSIILGVVALAAVVANFYPMTGMYEELHGKADARAKIDGDLKGLLSKPRTLPSLTEGGQTQPLQYFPTPRIIEQGKEATKKVSDGSMALLDGVVKMNVHEPLFPGALPGQMGDPVSAGEFARRYVQITGLANPDTRKGSAFVTKYKWGIPPLDPEVTAAAEAKKNEITNDMKRVDTTGNIINQGEIDAAVAQSIQGLPDNMRMDVAKGSMVYVDPAGLTISPNVGVVGTPPEPSTIWWAQVGLWVQEDIAKAVLEINSQPRSDGTKPANVMEAPVKEIVKITVPPAFLGVTPLQPGQAQQPPAEGAAPPPPSDPNAALQPNKAWSPTGRVNNGLFDVMQFDVDMVVEADQVPWVLDQIGKGRLISITQVSAINALDSAVAKGGGFFYGNRPVVDVKFRCEELFMRKWTKDLMPPPVRKQLAIPDEPAPGAAPAAPAPAATPPAGGPV